MLLILSCRGMQPTSRIRSFRHALHNAHHHVVCSDAQHLPMMLSKSAYLLFITTLRVFAFHTNHHTHLFGPSAQMGLRRSPRLRALNSKSGDKPGDNQVYNQVHNPIGTSTSGKPKAKRWRNVKKTGVKKKKEAASTATHATSLPRKLEFDALAKYQHVLSIDEAVSCPCKSRSSATICSFGSCNE